MSEWEEEGEDGELETDWIQEFEKIVEEGIYYPCETMVSLPVFCLFVEKNMIIRVSKKRFPILGGGVGSDGVEGGGCRNILNQLRKIGAGDYWMDWMKEHTEFIGSEDSVLAETMRLEKRAKEYCLSDVLLFNVSGEGAVDDICGEGEGKSEGGGSEYFQSYSAEEWLGLSELDWKDSVFLFHSINSVYFVFRDVPVIAISVEDLDLDSGGVGGLVAGSGVLVEMPVAGVGLGGSVGGGGIRRGGDVGRGRGTRKVRFWDGGSGSDSGSSSEDLDSDSDSGSSDDRSSWGKGTWLRKRQKNRRKTEKRKHVLTPAFIRSLFQ